MRQYKGFKQGAVALGLAVLGWAAAGSAQADDLTVERLDPQNPYSTATLWLNGTRYSNELVGQIGLRDSSGSFAAYCIELDQNASLGSTKNYTSSAYQNDALARLFTVAGLNSHSSGSDAVDTSLEMVALQLAVWETVYDGLGGTLGGGRFSVAYLSAGSAAYSQAASYLSAAAALQTGQYLLSGLTRYSNASLQDFVSYDRPLAPVQVSAVPEPQAAAMLLAGVATLAAVAWRRRRRIGE